MTAAQPEQKIDIRSTQHNRLTRVQELMLLSPLRAGRVMERDGLTYLSQYDVRAQLTRAFGFANWSGSSLREDLMFEDFDKEKIAARGDRPAKPGWEVSWKVTYRLIICAPNGEPLCEYVESAIAHNTQPQRAEASDMALKSATSYAMKRCAMNLGDQFGLGLYRKGVGPTPSDKLRSQLKAYMRMLVGRPDLVLEGTEDETPNSPVNDMDITAAEPGDDDGPSTADVTQAREEALAKVDHSAGQREEVAAPVDALDMAPPDTSTWTPPETAAIWGAPEAPAAAERPWGGAVDAAAEAEAAQLLAADLGARALPVADPS